jgi:hypothetical protein
MVEYNNYLLVMIDQYRMDNNMMELDMDHEEDNNMNPYFLEINNK